MTVIYRQLIMNDIASFTSQPKARFYDELFMHLNLDSFPERLYAKGRQGYSRHAMLRAGIVMKCECFEFITDLVDYLNNNLLIAYYCGFDITKKLPEYHTFDRFFNRINHDLLVEVMKTQVKELYEMGVLDASFIALDSTPMEANTKQNNPKSFAQRKFDPENHPTCDQDCALGVHTASNQQNEKKTTFYWGYKCHILVDCMTGLPICEMTTGANVADSTVAIEMLEKANRIIPLKECTFIADKGYDVKAIYNTVKDVYDGDCVIPLNTRHTKNPSKLPNGTVLCEAGLAMHKSGKNRTGGRLRQKYCCPYRASKDDTACPCQHKCFFNGKKNHGCTKYVTLPDDYRLSIDRSSLSFKKIYALRSEIERYNARFKRTGQERLWVKSQHAAANLATLAHIALLAVASAAVHSHKSSLMRSLKSSKRFA